MRTTLLAFLGLNLLVQGAAAIGLLGAPSQALPAMFGVPHTDSNRMLTCGLGVAVSASIVVLALAMRWVRRRAQGGLPLAALFGGWSLAAGSLYLFALGSSGGVFDAVRGAVLLGLVLSCARAERTSARER